MPPKRSDICHITFHLERSAILLSVAQSTSLVALKAQLLPTFEPLQFSLSAQIPRSTSDFRLWIEREAVEGAEGSPGLRELDEDDMTKSLLRLGWGRWTKVFISLKEEDGSFREPKFTIPDVEDEELADD